MHRKTKGARHGQKRKRRKERKEAKERKEDKEKTKYGGFVTSTATASSTWRTSTPHARSAALNDSVFV
jgi:hypothetical protein